MTHIKSPYEADKSFVEITYEKRRAYDSFTSITEEVVWSRFEAFCKKNGCVVDETAGSSVGVGLSLDCRRFTLRKKGRLSLPILAYSSIPPPTGIPWVRAVEYVLDLPEEEEMDEVPEATLVDLTRFMQKLKKAKI